MREAEAIEPKIGHFPPEGKEKGERRRDETEEEEGLFVSVPKVSSLKKGGKGGVEK